MYKYLDPKWLLLRLKRALFWRSVDLQKIDFSGVPRLKKTRAVFVHPLKSTNPHFERPQISTPKKFHYLPWSTQVHPDLNGGGGRSNPGGRSGQHGLNMAGALYLGMPMPRMPIPSPEWNPERLLEAKILGPDGFGWFFFSDEFSTPGNWKIRWRLFAGKPGELSVNFPGVVPQKWFLEIRFPK